MSATDDETWALLRRLAATKQALADSLTANAALDLATDRLADGIGRVANWLKQGVAVETCANALHGLASAIDALRRDRFPWRGRFDFCGNLADALAAHVRDLAFVTTLPAADPPGTDPATARELRAAVARRAPLVVVLWIEERGDGQYAVTRRVVERGDLDPQPSVPYGREKKP